MSDLPLLCSLQPTRDILPEVPTYHPAAGWYEVHTDHVQVTRAVSIGSHFDKLLTLADKFSAIGPDSMAGEVYPPGCDFAKLCLRI
jgi:hypothetical protein